MRRVSIVVLLLLWASIAGEEHEVAARNTMPAAVTVVSPEGHFEQDGASCSIIDERINFAARLNVSAEDGDPTYFSRPLSGGSLVEEDGERLCEVSFTFELYEEPIYLVTIGQDVEEIVGQAQIHATVGYTLRYEPDDFRVAQPSPTPEPTAVAEEDVPYLPNATAAWRAGAVPGSSENLLNEPLLMVFDVYGFASVDEAQAQLQLLSAWYVRHQAKILGSSMDDFREVSLGPIGDDRRAFVRESPGEDPPYLLALVRVGPNILVVDALSFGGDITEFVGEYLDGFLAGATDDPMSLVPTISDLPRGWSLVAGSPMDRLPDVKGGDATPAS